MCALNKRHNTSSVFNNKQTLLRIQPINRSADKTSTITIQHHFISYSSFCGLGLTFIFTKRLLVREQSMKCIHSSTLRNPNQTHTKNHVIRATKKYILNPRRIKVFKNKPQKRQNNVCVFLLFFWCFSLFFFFFGTLQKTFTTTHTRRG